MALTDEQKSANTIAAAWGIIDSERAANARLLAQIAQLEQQLAEARFGLSEVEALINDSHGVSGLHRNGDVAPWSELRKGGSFEEWLLGFDAAIARTKEQG